MFKRISYFRRSRYAKFCFFFSLSTHSTIVGISDAGNPQSRKLAERVELRLTANLSNFEAEICFASVRNATYSSRLSNKLRLSDVHMCGSYICTYVHIICICICTHVGPPPRILYTRVRPRCDAVTKRR